MNSCGSRDNDRRNELQRLLSRSISRDSARTDGQTASDERTGFTLRRCTVVLWFICFCYGGGLFQFAVPQYTHHRMVEFYSKDPINMTVIVRANYTEESSHHRPCGGHRSNKVQQATASWSLYYTLVSFLPAMFANLLWSSYADILGRRFAFIISCCGTLIRYCIFVLVVKFELSLVYMVLGALVDGICGAFILTYATLLAFVSDITIPGRERTVPMVIMELILGLCFTVSSFSSGYVISGLGFLFSAVLCFCVDLLGFLILVFFVPETMHREVDKVRSRNIFRVIQESFKFLVRCVTEKTKRLKYILLIIALIFFGMPAMIRSTVEYLYQLGLPFCWDPKKIGYFGSIKSAIASVTSVCGMYMFRKCLADDTIAAMTVFSNGVSYVVEAFAKTDAVLYTVPVLSALSNLPLTVVKSLFSGLTSPDVQGVMFASIAFIEGVCTLVGTVSTTEVYNATLSVMNGFVFLLMAFFTFIGAFFLLIFRLVNRRTQMEQNGGNNENNAS